MKDSTEMTVPAPLRLGFEHLDTLRTCADTILAALSSMEAVELGNRHEEVLANIARGMELLGEAALAIDLHVLAAVPGGRPQANNAVERELVAGLVDVMGIVEQVHSKVVGFRRMLIAGGGEHRWS